MAGTAAGAGVGVVVGVALSHGLPDGKLDGDPHGDPGGDLDGDGVPVGHGVDHVTYQDFMEADALSGVGSAAHGDHAGFSSIDAGNKDSGPSLGLTC